MPSNYVDQVVSGNGSLIWTPPNNQVIYAAWHFTALGIGARTPDLGNPDRVLRAGWITFGDTLSLGGVARDHWQEPIWLDFENGFWTPNPAGSQAATFILVASRIRWGISPGSSVHVFVFGF